MKRRTADVRHRPAGDPAARRAQWSDDDITRALIHELEHVRRADWPVFIATRIVAALYWFHPAGLDCLGRLGLEAERACDDAVLRGSERTAYAQQLVTLARERWRASAIPVLSMTGRSDLSARIAAVLDETQMRGRLGRARGRHPRCCQCAAGRRGAASCAGHAHRDRPAGGCASFRGGVDQREQVAGVDPEDSSIALMPGGRFVTTNWPLR